VTTKLNWRGQVTDTRSRHDPWGTYVGEEKYVVDSPERVFLPLRESLRLEVADIPGVGWKYVRRFRMLRCLLTGHLRWDYEFGHRYPATSCYRCHGRLA
jgi:hypothetical protein